MAERERTPSAFSLTPNQDMVSSLEASLAVLEWRFESLHQHKWQAPPLPAFWRSKKQARWKDVRDADLVNLNRLATEFRDSLKQAKEIAQSLLVLAIRADGSDD